MLYSFSKLVQPLLWPFNLGGALLLTVLFLLWRNKARAAFRLLAVTLVFLSVASLPVVSRRLRSGLESKYEVLPSHQYPKVDCIVVLGGTMAPLQAPRWETEELGGSRILPAWRLFRAGRAPLILVSSGWIYPSRKNSTDSLRSEAEDMRDLLIDLGVPAASILTEPRSRNTFENAHESALQLLPRGKRKILLVTSAFHMRRAVALFQHQGFEVHAAPTAHQITEAPFGFADLIPDLGGLGGTTLAIKEYFGHWAYSALLFARSSVK